ncbi:MAG: hypothetical protein V3U11_03300 [Planctomycetota bacterium]
MHRVAVVQLLIALVLAGCATPALIATAGPPDSTVYVDGRAAGYHGFADVPLHYYGEVEVSARVNLRYDRHTDYLEQHRLVPVPVPYSRWLFPVDFFLEAASYPFTDPYHHQVNLALKPRVVLAPGTADPDAEAVRDRALRARLQR